MFTLGIIDKLTDERPDRRPVHRRHRHRSTATATSAPIGGVLLKLITARDAGATVFLVPADNCAEAVTQVPDGLQLVKVGTLDDAIDRAADAEGRRHPDRLLTADGAGAARVVSRSSVEGQPQRRDQVRRQVGAAQRCVVVLAAHPHQAGAALRVPQHAGDQPRLRAVRMSGGLRRPPSAGRRTVRRPASGGSTTISWTSTQPATSAGQEICASASDSSPSGSDSWAIGVYTAAPERAARGRAEPPSGRRWRPARTAAAERPSRRRGELLDLGHRDREVGVLPPIRRAHADDLRTRLTDASRRSGWCTDGGAAVSTIRFPVDHRGQGTSELCLQLTGRGDGQAQPTTASAVRRSSTARAGLHQSFDPRSSPVAMRPPVGLPTMSKRAKRVLIALVSLAVLAILWFQFVGIYVDWLWFGEVGFREVFTTQAVSRIVLFLIAALVGGGLVFGSLYVAYRSRPVFVPTNEVDPLAPVPDDRHHPAEAVRLRHLRCWSALICGLSAQSRLDDRPAVAATAATSAPRTRSSATTSASTSSPCR